jgi:hypothetical protein
MSPHPDFPTSPCAPLVPEQRVPTKRLAEIDKTLLEHDSALRTIWTKLQPLLAPKTIPPEVFDKRAVEKGQVRFHDVACIEVTPCRRQFDCGGGMNIAPCC